MNLRTLLWRSLRFHARSHLGVVLGAAVGSAVLIGALVVGDSVRGSLRQMALARLGRVDFAVVANGRLFRAQLADDLQRALDQRTRSQSGAGDGSATASGPRPSRPPAAARRAKAGAALPVGGMRIAPVLQLRGIAERADAGARANHVQVLGVDARFWRLSRQPPPVTTIPDEGVILNSELANQLEAKPGDTLVLRLERPSPLPRDAPVSPQDNFSVALRLTVRGTITDDQFGRFSLRANQMAPFNAFVSLSLLQGQFAQGGRANLLLLGDTQKPLPTPDRLDQALRRVWQLADAGLEVRELPRQDVTELRTRRVFLDPPVARAALNAVPGAAGILTYFVNEFRVGDRTTPYSMITAMGTPVVTPDMRADEILINQWLADDLRAKPGDSLTLRYYVVGAGRALVERSARFRVRAVLPMTGSAVDPTLMPDFPGMANVHNCRDWDTGFPIRLDRIRTKDQQYWDRYRGTPKAFVTLAAGQRLWSNRFGDLTAVRFPANGTSAAAVRERLRNALNPRLVGLRFQPVRAQALAAGDQAQDFGQLFLGFSFFLVVAALLLVALLFQFGLEQRATEVGTLLALGFRPKTVRRLLLGEGAALSLIGGLLGMAGGVVYARAMLLGLTTIWRGAVGTSALRYHAEPMTLITGLVSGVMVSVLTVGLALRRQARQPARELLAEGAALEPLAVPRSGRPRLSLWLVGLCAAGAIGLLVWAGASHGQSAAGAFFGAGTLLLIAGLCGCGAGLRALDRTREAGATRLNLGGLGVRNCARRRRRSLATVALLACGAFLIVSVGANRQDPNQDWQRRSAGTGGFALLGGSTLPITQDLNTSAGRQFFGLGTRSLDGVRFVSLRVHDGDDASCLNLNHALTPRLLGLDPRQLAARGAFTFAATLKGAAARNPWLLLNQRPDDGAVPAIGDEASIEWALGKSVGDTVDYTDERGERFKLRLVGALAGSILQGSLLIAEDQFMERFPSESGYRMFLIDAPAKAVPRVAATLSRALQDMGLELTPTPRGLAELDAVENTYLSTFAVLGGLGLLLGSLGLGVVVLRNVLERRGELAVLRAVGFEPRALRWLVLSEHGALLLAGLAVGVGAALVAVLPALLSPGAQVPYGSLTVALLTVLLSGVLWTWLATRLALRGHLLDALRNN